MNELTHHETLHDDGFHEIQLSGKQLVALFMAATVVAVVIFLCGVQVGRNVKGDRVALEPSDTAASNAPPPTASTPTEAAPSSGPPAAEPPAPAQDDELSYAKRLQQAGQPASEKLTPPAQPAAPPAAAAPPPSAVAKGSAAASAPTASASGGRPGSWIVQLSALQDRSAAAKIASDLAAKGYPAFVVDPTPGAPTIYRVQVGGYPDREKADQAAHKLEKDEHFKPYVRSR